MQDLQKELGEVRPEVTLFSQRRKCNVIRPDFDNEIQERYRQFRERAEGGYPGARARLDD
jgi:hypothetical protein